MWKSFGPTAEGLVFLIDLCNSWFCCSVLLTKCKLLVDKIFVVRKRCGGGLLLKHVVVKKSANNSDISCRSVTMLLFSFTFVEMKNKETVPLTFLQIRLMGMLGHMEFYDLV